MNNYIGKKVEIREKIFGGLSSTNSMINGKYNVLVGVVTNIFDNKFIELDNKVLISLDYIYKIEVIG